MSTNDDHDDEPQNETEEEEEAPSAETAPSSSEQPMSERLKDILSRSTVNLSEVADHVMLPSKSKRPTLSRDQGRLSVREMNYGIPSPKNTIQHVKETHGEESWRCHVIHFIHQKRVQRILLALLCLDVLIIFTEFFLMSAYPPCTLIVRDCIACCPEEEYSNSTEAAVTEDSHSALRWLSGSGSDGGGHEELCDAGFQDFTGNPSCDEHKWHGVHLTEEILFWCTIGILSTFMLENLVEMMALTPCIYFRQFFMGMDFLIITISLVLELVFHFTNNLVYEELAGLLVFIRLWRFVRIGHGKAVFVCIGTSS